MKKLVSLILTLALACMLIPAVAEELTFGEWYMTEFQIGDQIMSPAMLGMSTTITLNEDGTAHMATSYGEDVEEDEGTWTFADGLLTIVGTEGDPMELVLADGLLTADMDGEGTMVFSQEAPEAMAMPEAVPAESEDEFLGEWSIAYISVAGVMLPAATFEVEGTLVVEPGKVTMTTGEEVTESASEFVDGTLKYTEGEDEVALELNDNGWLSLSYQLDEETIMVTYFEKAE